jgi:hypothetical protein
MTEIDMNGDPSRNRWLYDRVWDLLPRGQLSPFIGAGASIPSGFPSASELIAELREDLGPWAAEAEPTLRGLTWIYELATDESRLDDRLKEIFSRPLTPGPLHRLIATWSTPLILTTNYDCLIEQAFMETNRELLVVMTPPDKARRPSRAGRAQMWLLSGKTARRCETEYSAHPGVTVLYKLHGGLDPDGNLDWRIISETDYFQMAGALARGDYAPSWLRSMMSRQTFLFLGYSLRDPHVMAMLSDGIPVKHCLVTKGISELFQRAFRMRNVYALDCDIETFVTEIGRFEHSP